MTTTEDITVDFQAAFNGKTARGVFEEMSVGTFLMHQNGYTTYVYTGLKYVETLSLYAPQVIEMRYYGVTVHSSQEMLDNPWEAMGYNVMTEYNECGTEVAKVADSQLTRALDHLSTKAVNALRAETRASELDSELWDVKNDWRSLNAKLNAYAEEQRMCYDYERRLETWSADFSVMKLEGRIQEWQVGVKIPALSEDHFYVTVEATSPTAANEIVGAMSVTELLESAYKAGNLAYWSTTADAEIICPAE